MRSNPLEEPTAIGPVCPECRTGKHDNCTIEVLDSDDKWKVCRCLADGHE